MTDPTLPTDSDRKAPMNPNPNAMHPMCDCGTFHHRSCFFYDEEIDGMPTSSHLYDEMIPTTALTASSSVSSLPSGRDSYLWSSSCKHNMSPFTLPSGLTIFASAWRDVPYDRTPPDVGVYFDTSWFPAESFAYAVGWQDFGLPTISDADVARTAQAVLNHLEYGETVEVGCLGAHGRTGTFLALLTILDSESTPTTFGHKRAITYVRDNHCFQAIETKSQEAWIRRMSGKLRRGDI